MTANLFAIDLMRCFDILSFTMEKKFIRPWTSSTQWFDLIDINLIQHMTIEETYDLVLELDPLMALRILAEIFIHHDDQRIKALLEKSEINKHWSKYWEGELEPDDKDRQYANRFIDELEGKINVLRLVEPSNTLVVSV